MDLDAISGRSLAFLMCREVDGGDDEWVVLQTAIAQVGETFAFDLGADREPVPVPNGFEQQIKETPDRLRELLDGADFYVPFLVQDLQGEQANDLVVQLGVKWPGSEDAS